MLKRILISTIFSVFLFNVAFCQNNQALDDHNLTVELNTKSRIDIDIQSIHSQINQKSKIVSLPYMGKQRQFTIEPYSMHAGGANPYPEIQTFKLHPVDGESMYGRLTVYPEGAFISYFTLQGMYRIYPDLNSEKDIYYQEFGIARDKDFTAIQCNQHSEIDYQAEADAIDKTLEYGQTKLKRNGSTKREYRVAVMCTGEYYQANGASITPVRALAIANLADISAIFEKDLGVCMVNASGSPRIETDPDNDPFIPDNAGGGPRTQQAEAAIQSRFASSRYDIGHVFHTHMSGDGWSSGGLAGLGVICQDFFKARGWSGSFNNTTNGFIQLAAHEFGHQYNATHTFNGNGGSCSPDNHPAATAYEIGSGTTIMSYQGICDPDQNIPSSGVADNYFHANSLDRMVTYMENNGNCNEVDWTPDNNNEPVVDANPCGAVYELPRLTPFFLTASATDADPDDVLTYCWEGYDEDGNPATDTHGFIGNAAASTNDAPLWRSFPPSLSPTRYFPNIIDVKDNFKSDFEVLPNRNRDMRFRITVRDNNPAGGAIDWEEISINVTSTIGPLEVTAPTSAQVVQAGETLNVVWNTRNSESICANADIKISFDGGITYPLTLAEDVDYAAGTADVTIPASFTNTDQARIMVACADYDCYQFYDLNNGNFTIESNCFAPGNLLCDTEYAEFNTNDPGLNLGLTNIKGTTTASITGEVANVPPTMPPSVNDFNGNCTRIASLNNAFDTIKFVVTESGSYTFNFNTDGANFIKAYTIYEAATFQSNNGCASFIESNASFDGGFGFFDFMTVDLEACTEYLLGSHITNQNTRDIALESISGPGFMLVQEPSTDFAFTYLAVDANTETVIALDDNSDFTFLAAGDYHIHSVYYKESGPTPPDNIDPNSWIGQTLNDLLNSGDCYNLSANFKPIKVISTCEVQNLVFGTQSACDPMNNTFTQDISFDLDMGPGTGTVEINGEIFLLTGDSFSGTMTNLLSDGEPVDVAIIFSDETACNTFITDAFTAPVNCCPIDLELGQDIVACLNEDVILDAGPDGAVYQWFQDGLPVIEPGSTLNVTSDGTYSVIVTDSNGCAKEDEVTVSFNVLPTIDLGNDVLACEGDTVLITADTQSDSLVWFQDGVMVQNDNETSLEVFEDGVYEAVVTNEFNCSVSLSVTATFSPSPDVDFGGDMVLCEGDILTLEGGAPTDIHIWTKDGVELPEFTNMLEVTEDGVYGVTASNSFGCFDTDEIMVSFEQLPDLDLGEDQELCEGDDFVIMANSGGFAVEWFQDGVLIPDETDETLTVTTSGTYTAVASAGVDCSIEDDIVVTFNISPVVDLGEDQFLCEGQVFTLDAENMGEVIAWTQNGNPLGETGSTLEVTENGTYSVTVTNSNNCSTSDEAEITFEDLPDLDLGEDKAFCVGQSYIIVAQTGGFSIEWYQDGNLLTEDDGTLSVTETGTYRAVVFSNMDCMVEDEIFVEFLESPEVDLGEDAVLCEGEVLTLDAGDPDNVFVWTQDGNPLPETGNILEVTENGTYSVLVTNAGNCSSMDEIMVSFQELPDLDLGQDQLLCEGEIYTIEISALGFDIEWYMDNQLIVDETGETLEVTATGDYRVLVSSAASNCSIEDSIRVEFNASPEIDLGEDQLLCEGSEFVIVAGDSDNSYEWFLDGIDIMNDLNSFTATESGIYIVNATNEFDCTTSDTLDVAFNALPDIDIGMDQELCQGDNYIITATTNGFDIEWSLDGNLLTDENDLELTTTQSGQYVARVASGIDCFSSDTVNILYNPVPGIDLGSDVTACEGEVITLDAGTTGFEFIWYQDGAVVQQSMDNTLEVTVEGEFVVEATNEFNCTSQDTVQTTYIETPTIDLEDDITFCAGDEVTINSTTNVSAATWFLNGTEIMGEIGTELTVSAPGEYIVNVGTGGQCQDSDTITLTEVALPDFNIDGLTQECTGTEVMLTVDAEADESIQWTLDGVDIVGETNASLSVSTTGMYGATLTNPTGCSSSDEIQVEFFDPPVNQLLSVPNLCEGETFTMTATSDGDVYSWSESGNVINGETSLELDITSSGSYSFTATNDVGCSTTTDFDVTFNPIPDADLGADQSACTGQTVMLSVEATAGANYEWTLDGQPIAGATSNTLDVDAEGTYGLTVTSADNCTATDEVNFTFNTPPTLDIQTDASFCEGSSADLELTTDASEISWTLDGNVVASNVTTLNVDAGGEYIVAVTSDDGCTLTETITVNAFSNPVVSIDDIDLCPGEFQDIDLTPGLASYEWQGITATGASTTITHEDFGVITTVNASVTVTDNNNCSASDDFVITYNPELEAMVVNDDVNLCIGETQQLNVTGGLYYEWTDPNGTLSATDISNPIASPTTDITYSVLVTDNCPNNMEEFDIQVNVNPLPDANAGPDTCVIQGQLFELQASGGLSYIWDNQASIEGSFSVSNPIINIDTATVFTVTVIDANGCFDTDEVEVCIIEDPTDLLDPITLITPNGDGKNDELIFRGLEAFPDNKLTIFNRWGNIIYEKNGYQRDSFRWSGLRDGVELPPDTYYYVLEFAGTKIKTSLTILRD